MARVAYLSRSAGPHDDRWVATLEHGGHQVTPVGLANERDATARLRRLRGHCDLVVAGPLTDAAPAALEADVAPVLGICWGFDVLVEALDQGPRDRMVRTLPGLAGVHVDCDALARAVEGLGVEPRRVSTAAWGVDLDYFTVDSPPPGVRAAAGFTADDFVVLSTRAWEPLYRVDLVLDAVAQLARSRDDLRLVLAGAGSLASQLHDRLRRLALTDVTVLPGVLAREQIRDWLRAADVYVTASRSDGSSLSLLEALACGLPAVVPRVGGNPEWVSGPLQGRLFTSGDPTSLAGALEQLSGVRPDLAARRRCREGVLPRGDWQRNRRVFLAAVDRAVRAR